MKPYGACCELWSASVLLRLIDGLKKQGTVGLAVRLVACSIEKRRNELKAEINRIENKFIDIK